MLTEEQITAFFEMVAIFRAMLKKTNSDSQKRNLDKMWIAVQTNVDSYATQLMPKVSNNALTHEDSSGDGSCFYHSVAPYLGKDPGTLRKEVAQYIRDNEEAYRLSIEAQEEEGQKRTFEAYTNDIEKNNEWADGIAQSALMNKYGRFIAIILPSGEIYWSALVKMDTKFDKVQESKEVIYECELQERISIRSGKISYYG